MKYAIRLIKSTPAAISMIVAIAVWAAGDWGLLSSLENATGDVLIRLAAPFPPPAPYQLPDVAVVAIDSQSMSRHSGDPRTGNGDVYAELIRRLEAAGVHGIALDLRQRAALDPRLDRSLVLAIEGSGRVVLGVASSAATHPQLTAVPAHLRANAAALGAMSLSADEDGVVRRVPRSASTTDGIKPSLAAVALSVAEGETTMPPYPGEFMIDYRRARPRFPVISLVDLLDERFDPGSVAGRFVFVGPTAPELGPELLDTPLVTGEPAVFIHAHAYRTLAAERAGEWVPRVRTPWHGWLFAAVLSLALGSIMHLSTLWRTLILVACGLALTLGAFALAVLFGVLDVSIAPALVWVSHCLLATQTLRSRLGLQTSRRASPWSVVAGACEVTRRISPGEAGELELPLSLLGEAVGASGISLVCEGESESDRVQLNWRPGLVDEFHCPQVGSLRLAQQVAEHGEIEYCEGAFPGESPGWFNPTSSLYVPLRSDEATVGVLIVERQGRTPLRGFELQSIAGAAAQLAINLRYRRLFGDIEATFATAWTALARAVEARDGYTELHSSRMVSMASLIAHGLGMSDEEVSAIRLGALLHDVGKVGIRDSVLNKPNPFTPEERRDMERHPLIGTELVASIHGLPKASLDCVRHHHESWDGTGYPDGLAGEEIPLSARIVCVVDVWDAMQSSRPYRGAVGRESAFEYFEKYRGVRFDPCVVDVFLALLAENEEDFSSGPGPAKP